MKRLKIANYSYKGKDKIMKLLFLNYSDRVVQDMLLVTVYLGKYLQGKRLTSTCMPPSCALIDTSVSVKFW